ncbi:unnamed protein product [Caenorhabditis auriculariae]|uniref:Uncharacterized protein n=1 Tax=Caenorhabditis auriculariae TaxID=2777116 RepID=A0A8S1H9V9_9PELO|nr:unnamed protein product [Caenorhabditis auriculariae]
MLLPLVLSLQFVAVRLKNFGPITDHFETWLNQNGYEKYNFGRSDMGNFGSFGGKADDNEEIIHEPVVFIHGNSDAALTANDFSTGWTKTVSYFVSQNYSMAELYATSWGNTNTTQAVFRDHDCVTTHRLRMFFEAVLQYTGATRISVISHSMGVTLGRKIVQGGFITADDGTCNIGKSLTPRVNVFLGIAGANFGLCVCILQGDGTTWPTCNMKNGLWPGDSCGENQQAYSQFLMDINARGAHLEGKYIFSMWSKDDDLIGYGDNVWGRFTSEIPNSAGNVIYSNRTHMQTKEDSAADQFFIVTRHALPSL